MPAFLRVALLALLSAFVIPTPARCQVIDSAGEEFIFGFLRPQVPFGSELEVHLTSPSGTTVSIEYPVGTVIATQSVSPGGLEVVSIPSPAAEAWIPNATFQNAVRLSAQSDFTAYVINRRSSSSDAALALPVDALNRDYIVIDFEGKLAADGVQICPAEFVVVGTVDGTSVTITPTANLVGGRPAGVPFTVTLDRGEGYFALSDSTESLTGTVIEADRAVSLTNGVECAQVPAGAGSCDHIFEVAQPVQTWGSDFILANTPRSEQQGEGSIYRIVASEDGTEVLLDGAAIATLDASEWTQVGPLLGEHTVGSSGGEAIYVAQFLTNDNSPGDPSMGNVIPQEQFLNSYVFSTVGDGQFTHQLTIIAENTDANAGSVMLDGMPVPTGRFQAIPGTNYSVARYLTLMEGPHATSSPNGHGITVAGSRNADSYLYPGGARFAIVNPTGDANPPIVVIQGTSGVARDDRPSEDVNMNDILDPGEDLNMNGQIDTDSGINSISLDPSSMNLEVSASFDPGDPVVTFDLSRPNGAFMGVGEVVVTDLEGNETRVAVSIGTGQFDTTNPTCATTQPAPGRVDGVSRDDQAGDSGILSVVLEPGSTNLILTVDDFNAGDDTVTWVAQRYETGASGAGVVTTMDLAGNTAVCSVTLSPGSIPSQPGDDCDNDGVDDIDELAALTQYDWNQNGRPDACEQMGPLHCSPQIHNSTGVPAFLIATGTSTVSDASINNDGMVDLVLAAYNLPPSVIGYFAASRTMGMTPVSGSTSSGNLCLGGPIGGFRANTAMSSASGELRLDVSFVNGALFPGGSIQVIPGDTVFFQAWFRDPNAVFAGNNLSDVVEIFFQ